MATLNQLIDRVADRLSMSGGVGVQTYAEDRIAEMIQHKFDVLFDEAWWPQFLDRATWTLDGTLGIVTTDISEQVKRFDDIRTLYPTNSNRSLSKLGSGLLNTQLLNGTTPIYYEALGPSSAYVATRIFRVLPLTSVGTIEAQFRTKPDTFAPEDTINFDDQALILGATFDYLEDDGTNQNATQKFQLLFEARVKQLKNNLNSGAVLLDSVPSHGQPLGFTVL